MQAAKPSEITLVKSDVIKIDGLPIDPHYWRRNPSGKFTRLNHAAHQRRNKPAILCGW